ncbi:glycoprotein-N-acetylgalactosamine 3-beta-galactosyltransferase 1-like [Scaptodrosophila lebanonensis]|uniref:N-acetylgalactosaminide beta-1,3-galactosyltransferase n=1 Tax=Drosophila lebanonensis TaxID=7225 RepID=A0A6J2TS39_DROLE|nr:glycoprotein-N-acetylgalactosamine 3-beta-galactosyltransferase 1-like [Scaptodrosophila lebanonensis]
MKISWLKRKILVFLLTFLVGWFLGYSLSQITLQSCWPSVDPDMKSGSSAQASHGNGNNNPGDEDLPLATKLYKETRVLCIVLTSPERHQSRALHVKRTWGARCNKLLFMSTAEDEILPTVVLDMPDGHSNSWSQTRESLRHVYDNYFGEFDWFLKADDDTYVVMENLRAFLYAYTPSKPIYFGTILNWKDSNNLILGGSGYVLSKSALVRFATQAYFNDSICKIDISGFENIEMGHCLNNVGVMPGDSHDERGIELFSPMPASFNEANKFSNESGHTAPSKTCCSESAISFHYVEPIYFYILDFFLYKLHLFGSPPIQESLPEKKGIGDLVKSWGDWSEDLKTN